MNSNDSNDCEQAKIKNSAFSSPQGSIKLRTSAEELFGIDLGTTNSCIARFSTEGPEVISIDGSPIVPSVVAHDGQRWLVGQEALNWSRIHPESSAQSFKRHIGEDEHKINIGEEQLTPEFFSQMVLEYLKRRAEEICGCKVSSVVITIPAWFGEKQRQATLRAGKAAGLNVIRLIHEPTAASLVYQESATTSWKDRFTKESFSDIQQPSQNPQNSPQVEKSSNAVVTPELWAVYDLGGGTFDISIVLVQGDVVEVKASCGNSFLGGDDFDALLADRLLRWLKDTYNDCPSDPLLQIKLKHIAERAKISLSSEISVDVKEIIVSGNKAYDINLTVKREEFEQLIDPLLQGALDKVREALADANAEPEHVTRLLLVGGSTRIPIVQQQLSQVFSRQPESYVDPDLSVAMGAAIQAGLAAGRDLKRIVVDVCPHTLGIAVLNRAPRGPVLPLDFAKNFLGDPDDEFSFDEHVQQILSEALSPSLDFSPLIRRNAKLPVKASHKYQKVRPEQVVAEIQVYQGESTLLEDNQLVGTFQVPFKNDRSMGISVTFEYDLNGVVKIGVEEESGNKHSHIMNLIRSVEENSDASYEVTSSRDDMNGPNAEGENDLEEVDGSSDPIGTPQISNFLIQKVERALVGQESRGQQVTQIIQALDSYRRLLIEGKDDQIDDLEDQLFEWLEQVQGDDEGKSVSTN